VRRRLGVLALAGVLAGCGGGGGGGGGSSWSDSACRRQATSIAEHAGSMVLHYGGTVYPADMSYLGLRKSLVRYRAGGCPNTVLGAALARRLSPAKRDTLVRLLPRRTARSIRAALAAVR
jgi:hypothetical protein